MIKRLLIFLTFIFQVKSMDLKIDLNLFYIDSILEFKEYYTSEGLLGLVTIKAELQTKSWSCDDQAILEIYANPTASVFYG